jgi:hypothetical protein
VLPIQLQKRRKPVTKIPQKRDPKIKPLLGNHLKNSGSIWSTANLKEELNQTKKDTKFTTCKGCMGLGGMDGNCPKCGGTGFSD